VGFSYVAFLRVESSLHSGDASSLSGLRIARHLALFSV
jgi:hypothetical protein